MAPKRALMGCNITLFGRNPSWDHATQSKAGNWLAHLSGRLVSFGDNTTHLIVSKKRWTEDPKPAILQKALANPNIKILTFDWMEDCLNSQSRKREQPYEWAEIEAAAAKVKAKSKKQLEKEEKKKAANSVPGMMSEVFHESTQPFVDPVEARKLEKQLEREREEQKKREQEAKEEKIKRKKEQAMIFGRGAMRARNVALSGECSAALVVQRDSLTMSVLRQTPTTSSPTARASNSTSASPKSTPARIGTKSGPSRYVAPATRSSTTKFTDCFCLLTRADPDLRVQRRTLQLRH